MTACLILPSWIVAIVGWLVFVVGAKICHVQYRNPFSDQSMCITAFGAVVLCAGFITGVVCTIPYAYLLPCVTVIP
jgi:uncharacterized membrane protein